MKKQHLDPNAKRDFSVLNREYHKIDIKDWLADSDKIGRCPFGGCSTSYRQKCVKLFPEIKHKVNCPCGILYVKDVIKIARAAIKQH